MYCDNIIYLNSAWLSEGPGCLYTLSLSHSFDWENSQKDGPTGHTLSFSLFFILSHPPIPPAILSLPSQDTKLYRIMLSGLICERNSALGIT